MAPLKHGIYPTNLIKGPCRFIVSEEKFFFNNKSVKMTVRLHPVRLIDILLLKIQHRELPLLSFPHYAVLRNASGWPESSAFIPSYFSLSNEIYK